MEVPRWWRQEPLFSVEVPSTSWSSTALGHTHGMSQFSRLWDRKMCHVMQDMITSRPSSLHRLTCLDTDFLSISNTHTHSHARTHEHTHTCTHINTRAPARSRAHHTHRHRHTTRACAHCTHQHREHTHTHVRTCTHPTPPN